ncbi:RasGEF domain containing protein [Trichomonas vaginalis G3]|uniref:RasGEF domain containing protein n=1 Tax=Trichomonas vaginalis (strain ATCC PRA-98 / G3) TaxID=412133 RepID=A2EJW8_TRIV3|nr:guanyl-nucleotide exchange factor protein [Trichomonas vaginalis G3]EAY07036.1 RasGEF domain containing protein [Trichomonas vaginalis G3]KAI5529568.1 guanyl-nucleotide exchange factor protein [Trichomonas vaginalis G3]|eukprot:XP_001319259.1 RasGEF domain containing protein [Trichomonas vaginalis G3]
MMDRDMSAMSFQTFQKDPLSVSRERDLANGVFKSSVDVDRSMWRETVLNRNPEIKRLRETVNPLQRAIAFSRQYLPDNRFVDPNVLISLISQHLRTLGLVETHSSLHKEWEHQVSTPHLQESALALLAQRAIQRSEKFWELTVPSCHNVPGLKQTQAALASVVSTTIGSTPKLLEDTSPLSQEKEGDENFIKYENGFPVEASLNQLIYYSTSRKDRYAELMNAMCLTINSYSSNKVFLKKICERTLQCNDQMSVVPCMKLISVWINGAGKDLEPEILEKINLFFEEHVRPRFPTINITSIREIKKTNHLRDGKTIPVELGNIQGLWNDNFDIIDLPASELARQLTVWSYTRYYAIQRTELLDCAWEKPRLKHRAPNVVALTTHFNLVSQWAASKIIESNLTKKRLDTLSYFINVLNILYDTKNYLDAMAILGGLDHNALYRMKVHFSLLPQSDRDTLEKIRDKFSPDKQFAKLRSLFDEAIENKEPALPYIGVLLSDLFKFDDATQPFINGLINVRKVMKVYSMIYKIECFSNYKYMYLPIDQVQEKLSKFEPIDEDKLLNRSFEVEPESAQTELDLLNQNNK